MVLKLLLAGAALALSVAGAQAQTLAPPAPVAPAASAVVRRDADPALWVVKDEDTTIYLFGTVHVLKPGLGWFDEAVRKAFDDSDTVVLEVTELDPAASMSAIRRYALNPGGPTVTSLLPPDRRAAYAAAMADAGVPATAFDAFDPWFPAIYLAVATLPKYGFDPNQGVEKTITRAAKAAGKPVVGLETIDEQLGLFDGLSQDLQVRVLVATLDELSETEAVLDTMVERWAAGDPDGLSAVMDQGLREVPEVAKVLLADRNARWAEWIEKRLATPGTVFVSVGAGHLAGGDSVQVYLKKRNLAATRIAY